VPALAAGLRCECPRLSNRKRAGHILVDLAHRLPRREIAPFLKENGVPTKRQRAFDAQEAVFARGWDVKDAWYKTGMSAG
jgi:hypothetical protein